MDKENNPNLPFARRPHILIVDDDARICDLLFRYLNEHGFIAAMADNADKARQVLELFEFDALIVDIMMPGETGIEFTKELRQKSDIPVLFLTALGETEDRVEGFESGADDYLVKPFEAKELVLRLKAILRRTAKPIEKLKKFRIGDWIYDTEMNELHNGTDTITLTASEATLLETLAQYNGELVERDVLAEKCGVDPDSRTIDVQVTRLRSKIEEDSKNPRHLRTVRGKGYMLRMEGI